MCFRRDLPGGLPGLGMILGLVMLLACVGGENLLMIAAPTLDDRSIHVVIENPKGSFEKWEVQSSGELVQEFRVAAAAAYPSAADMVYCG